ncbi:MAG UNVERIFIED_CONTAM: hypothetical protein LVR29_31325, partial [Microcystis novacekii LVE1205-3]
MSRLSPQVPSTLTIGVNGLIFCAVYLFLSSLSPAAWLIGNLFGPGGLTIKLIFDIIAGLYWLWGPVYRPVFAIIPISHLPYGGFWRGRVFDAFVTEELIGEEERVNKRGELEIIENRQRCINLEIGDQTG